MNQLEQDQNKIFSEVDQLKKLYEQVIAIHRTISYKMDQFSDEQQHFATIGMFGGLSTSIQEGLAGLREDLERFRGEVAAMQCWGDSVQELNNPVRSLRAGTEHLAREQSIELANHRESTRREIDRLNQGLELYVQEATDSINDSVVNLLQHLDGKISRRIDQLECTVRDRIQAYEKKIERTKQERESWSSTRLSKKG